MQRSRPGSEVATWSALVGQKRRRDMGGSVGGHDMETMSRHRRSFRRSRPGKRTSRPGLGTEQEKRCRDMILAALMSRHRSEVAT